MAIAVRFVLLLLLTLASGAPRGWGAVSLENLDAQEDVALLDRLQQMLAAKYRAWSSCPASEEKTRRLPAWFRLINASRPLGAEAADARATLTIELIFELQAAAKGLPDCPGSRAPLSSVRKPIGFPPALASACLGLREKACGSRLRAWYRDIAPACYRPREKGVLPRPDQNACFAGDDLMLKAVLARDLDVRAMAPRLSLALLVEAQLSGPGGGIDLENVFSAAFPGASHPDFWTLWAVIGTSGNSGLTGWLQGFEDRLLVNDLNTGLSPSRIIDRFKVLQQAKIDYVRFRTLADDRGLALRYKGRPVTAWNRHNVMAGFLGCVSADSKRFTQKVVGLAGSGYEALDFVSHVLEGVSLSASAINFSQDTGRYRESVLIGYEDCHR